MKSVVLLLIIGGMFGFGHVPLVTAETLYYLRSYAAVIVFAIVGSLPYVKRWGMRFDGTWIEPVVMAALLLLCTASLVDGSFNPFLYFRF